MAHEIELIRKNQLQVSKWSGGTTTQLAIFPKEAVYNQCNFKWRLSSAKVEVEESVFTSLPNINRIIMIIEGKLILAHEGHHKSILKPFDQDCFSGNWKTKSLGKVTDFNLMMDEDCEGELEAIHLGKEQSEIVSFNHKMGATEIVQAIYCVNGQVKIENATNNRMILHEGDIVLITAKGDMGDLNFKIYNEEEYEVDLIKATIRY